MKSWNLHLRRIIRSLISAFIVLLMMAFPAGRPVFAVCNPAPTPGNNVITCDGADDTIDALAGNDQVNGGAGNDSITGGTGNDTLTGGAGDDTLIGGVGNDSYVFDTDSALGVDTVTEASGEGTDTLNFATTTTMAVNVDLSTIGSNQVVNPNLTLYLTAEQIENVTGGTGNDVLTGNSLNNIINGGNGNNTITGAGGNDTLTGGTGADVFVFDTDNPLGRDVVNGGTGTDRLDFSGSSTGVTVNLGTTTIDQTVNSNLILRLSANLENITGGSGDDTLTGSTAANTLLGGDGNDTLNGGTGNDTLNGGAGNDRVVQTVNANQTLTNTLATGTGNDTLVSIEEVILTGGAGNNTFTVSGWTGTATIDGAGGTADTIVSSNDAGFVLTNALLTRSSGGVFNLTNVERATLTGGNGDNTLDASAFTSGIVTLSGGNGNDTLSGGSQNDSLIGGNGNDILIGGAGNDALNGGAGTDRVIQTVDANQTLTNALLTGTGSDTLAGIEAATLTGGAGDNTFTVTGWTGTAIIDGAGGTADSIVSSNNANFVLANALLTRSTGGSFTLANVEQATLTGGAGNNTFTVSGWTNSATINGAGGTADIIVSSNDANFLLTNALLTRSTGGVFNLANVERTTLTGGNGNNTLDASAFTAGLVTLSGGNGDDTLFGGSQNDTLTGGSGNDNLNGGAGTDTLTGGVGSDTYTFVGSVLGTDTINEAANADSDTLDFSAFTPGGTPGVTINLASTATQTVNTGDLLLRLQTITSIENVIGSAGADVITGNTRDNMFTGGGGNDTLTGGTGNDSYAFNTTTALGTDTITDAAGGGTDTLDFTGSSSAITVDLSDSISQAVNANLNLVLGTSQIEDITGGTGNDTLTGNTLNNVINGGSGDDNLIGGDGDDTLDGGAGTDRVVQTVNADQTLTDILLTGAGSDTLANIEDATLTGGAGNNTFTVSGWTGAAIIDGLGGTDTIVSSNDADFLLTDTSLTRSTGGVFTLANIEQATLTGGNGNNTLAASAFSGMVTLSGGDGDDNLIGGSGDDVLTGGNDDDNYAFDTDSALGTDTINEVFGGGTDNLDFTGSTNAITVNLGTTGNQVVNGNLTLNMTAAQVENVTGGSGDDTLTGNSLNNALNGGADNDNLIGGNGNDTLNGEFGNDILNGGTGDDILNGGDGNDTLSTSAGIDTINGGADDDLINIITGDSTGNSIDGGLGNNIFVFQLGATGSIALISSGTDTLDFSSFGMPVTINLSNNSQQGVGGGLFLTLTGFFQNINGSAFNDTITGNTADNIINGGAGNDTLLGGAGSDTLNGDAGNDILDGGAGSDALDGGADIDTVQNYSASDTHVNIENGFPASGSGTSSRTRAASAAFIPVTGGVPVVLSCESNPVLLKTQDNSLAFFYNLCGYTVVLDEVVLIDEQLPLPNDSTYLSGLSLALIKESQALDEFPEGSLVNLSFPVPADLGSTISGFSWDTTTSAWVEVPVVVADGYATLNVDHSGSYILTIE